MQISIQQALYGEKNKGHGLIAHTFDSNSIPSLISLRTDLPSGHVDYPGRDFFLGAITTDKYYVLLKSIPDTSAHRTGFVHTFALFVSIVDLELISDFHSLVDLMPNQYDENWIPSTIKIDRSALSSNGLVHESSSLKLLIHGILNETSPVVLLGEDNLIENISLLWVRLPFQLRSKVKFRVSFGPNDLDDKENQLFVYSPANLIDKWHTHFTIKSTDEFEKEVLTEFKYLLDLDKSNNSVLILSESLFIPIDSFNIIKQLAQLDLFLNSEEFSETIYALTILQSICSEKQKGKNLKIELVKKLAKKIDDNDISGILSLRNLKTISLPFKKPLETSVQNILTSFFFNPDQFKHAQKLVDSYSSQKIESWLDQTLKKFFLEAFSNPVDTHGVFLWKIIEFNDNSIELLNTIVKIEEQLESILIKTIPKQLKLDEKNLDSILVYCSQNELYRLHAHLAGVFLDGEKALRRQLEIDTKPDHSKGFLILSSLCRLEDFIEFSMKSDDVRIRDIFIQLMHDESSMITSLNPKNALWLDAWSYRTEKGIDIFKGVKNPKKITQELMEQLVDNANSVPLNLLKQISESKLADIGDYSNRDLIIQKLPKSLLSNFLKSSTLSTIKLFLKNPNRYPIPIGIKQNVRNDESTISILQDTQFEISNVLELFDSVNQLKEHSLIHHLNKRYKSYNQEHCESLGVLIKEKKWSNVYEKVKDVFASHNNSFDRTVKICKGSFPLLDNSFLKSLNEIFSAGDKSKFKTTTNPTKKISMNKKKVLILTAIDVEYRAVKSFVENYNEIKHPETNTIYGVGTYGSKWDVALYETEPGNSNAAIEAERAINYIKPDYVMFVGIAGGVKDVKIGDVVIANKVYGIESAKDGKTYQPRFELGQPSYGIKEIAKALRKDDHWLEKTSKEISQTIDSPFILNAFLKPIAAGEKLVASTRSETYKKIKAFSSDSLAVEMEGIGFLKACYAHSKKIEFILIRGISDLIDKKSETDAQGGQELASLTASAFAFELLNRIDSEN